MDWENVGSDVSHAPGYRPRRSPRNAIKRFKIKQKATGFRRPPLQNHGKDGEVRLRRVDFGRFGNYLFVLASNLMAGVCVD